MGTPTYAAYGKRQHESEWTMVTLGRQIFLANKGLLIDMVEAMKKKHPTAEFKIERVS